MKKTSEMKSALVGLKRLFCGVIAAGASFVAVAGVLPTGYTRLAYIESDGTQFIDTEHHPASTTAAEIDFQLLSTTPIGGQNYCIPFGGARDASNGYPEIGFFGFFLWPNDLSDFGKGATWAVQCGNGSVRAGGAADTQRHVVSVQAGEQCLDGVVIANQPGFAPRIVNSIYLFAQHCNWKVGEIQGQCALKLYSFKIREAGTLVFDFYPAKNAAGVAGLYERITGRFFTKGAGNDLVAGDEIEDVDAPAEHVAVTPVTCTIAADGTTADFTFAPSTEARAVYVAYGPTDAGENLDAWAHCDKIADLPANAEKLTGVALPAGFNAENGVLRAYVAAAPLSASSYVRTDSLLAQWDAIENAGLGQAHDANAAKPQELRGGIETELTGTMPAGDTTFTLGSGYLHFTSQKIIDAINAGHATVEMTMMADGTKLTGNGGFFCAGNTSRAFWMYQQSNFISAFSYHAAMRNEWCNLESGNNIYKPENITCPHTFTTVLNTTRETSYFADNGVKKKTQAYVNSTTDGAWSANLYRHTTDCTDANCYIGVLPGDWLNSALKANAKVCSIRIYNRVLTTAEIARNVKVDQARFNGVTLNEFSAAAYFPKTPLMVEKVTRAAGVPTGATLSFAGSDKPRDLYLVLARQDQGAQISGWTSRRLVQTIAAGVMSAEVAFSADEQSALGSGGGFRFFLAESDYTAADYAAPDDLLLQFDGIENLAPGLHDAYARNPRDLRGGRKIETDKPLSAAADHFLIGYTNGYMVVDCPEFMQQVNAGDATVELVLAPNRSAVHNGGIFCLGGKDRTAQRGLWLYQQNMANDTRVNPWMFSATTYHGVNGNYSLLLLGDWTDTLPSTWTVLLNSGNWDSSICQNGVSKKTFQRFGTTATDSTCYIGLLPGTYIDSNLRANAKVHSVRIYRRKLTADEIARNVKVDGQRFRGEVVAQAFSGFEKVYRGTLVVFR